MHRMKLSSASSLVARTDRYGNRVAAPGTLYANCSCGWSMTLQHTGADYEQVSATLDVAVKGHIDGATLQDATPNSGHPLFRMPPKKYIRKVREFEALQWHGDNKDEFNEAGYWVMEMKVDGEPVVYTGKPGFPVMQISVGDWVVKTPEGQLLALTDEQFKESFEETFQKPRAFEWPVC